VVILAAGGLGTPQILLNSGIDNASTGLFMDLLVNTYGITEDLNLIHEPAMTLVNHDFYKSNGFILSPFVHHPGLVKFIEFGVKGLTMRDNQVIGIMTKVRDESTGRVYPDGTVSKSVTDKDREKLGEGSRIATEILKKVGVKKTMVSKAQGAHPGGTSAIGRVVDSNLQTEVNNLFVCDASVLPIASGLPPILTIVALAKRLAKLLVP
jgi:choline dehydrogenase-like flavoprotein